jgi:hypothetical protein
MAALSSPAPSSAPVPGRTRAVVAVAVAAVIVLVLPHVPVASLLVRPLVWLSTLAHEGGHGVGAMLVGGTFKSLEIWPDASGVATSSYDASVPVRRAVVAAGGLLGPAVVAVLLLWLGLSARLARAGVVVAALASLALLSVTTGFATLLVLAFAAACVAVAVVSSSSSPLSLARLFLLVLAVDLSLSVFSRADYLFVGEAQTGGGTMPSDVAQVAMALGGHYLLWGALIGLGSVLLLALGLLGFFAGDTALHRLHDWRAGRRRR